MPFDEFEHVDEELSRAFSGIRAPSRLASSIMNRVRMPAPTRLPEYLDALGWMGVLSFAAGVVFFAVLK